MGIASNTLAGINKAQWSDYVSRFIPLENELINAYNNQGDRKERMTAVTQSAAQSSDTAQDVARRGMSRYGLSLDDQDSARSAQLSKTASIVDAKNTNREQMNARDQLLISGGLTSRGV